MSVNAFPQTSISESPDAAIAGMLSGNSYDNRIDSYVADEAIPAGSPVSAGATYAECEIPDNAGEVANFLGVAMYDASRMPNGTTANHWKAGDVVSVVSKGRVWVAVGATMTVGNVYIGNATTYLGKFYSDTQSGNATFVGGVKCIRGGSAFALLDINLPSAVGATGATGPTGPTGP